jgi:hypothetical protein
MLAAVFYVNRNHEIGSGIAAQLGRTSGSEKKLVILAATSHAVWKRGESRQCQCVGVVGVLLGWAHDSADMFEMLFRARVHWRIGQAQKVARFRPRTGAEKRSGRTAFLAGASSDGLDYESRQARMQRVPRHASRFFTGRFQSLEQLLGARDCRVGRRLEPGQFRWVSDSHRSQVEAQLRQLAARDLRRVMIGAAMEVLERVEPQDTPRSGASGAACSLRGRCFADAPDFERR